MWFLFGLVTLTSFCAFQAYKKVYAAWEGEKGSLDGVDYQYKFQKHKGKIQAALVGIEGPPGFDFTFKRERSHDRFF